MRRQSSCDAFQHRKMSAGGAAAPLGGGRDKKDHMFAVPERRSARAQELLAVRPVSIKTLYLSLVFAVILVSYFQKEKAFSFWKYETKITANTKERYNVFILTGRTAKSSCARALRLSGTANIWSFLSLPPPSGAAAPPALILRC